MSLKKTVFLTIFIFFFIGSVSNAEVLYKNYRQGNLDYTFIPIQELKEKVQKGDKKSEYLLALHKVNEEGDKREGIQQLEQLAASGIVDAKQSLYEISSRVKNSSLTPEKGLAYLKEAAEEGYDISQTDLARVYNRGLIVNQDMSLYHYWAEKAAKQGNADALIFTASDYFAGRGVPRDDTKGFEWLMTAYNILGKNFIRWELLGEAYETGRGTPVDLTRAYMCYDMDGTAGIEDKERIAPRMTAEQRAEGLRLSREWQEKHHVYTMQSLGLKRQKDGSYQ